MRALRFHRGTLSKPQLIGDAYVVEGHAARVHAVGDGLHYGDHDEYRDSDELARIVAQLPGTAVTLAHPSAPLAAGAKDARIVGTVADAWLDGEHAAVRMRITDRQAVEAIKLGTRELSLGYACLVDARGFQRSIVVDHLAVVEAARCGSTCALRIDQHPHSKGSLMDPSLPPLAAQMKLNIDGLDTRAAAVKIITTASPGVSAAELASKSDVYLVARAGYAVEDAQRSAARRDAFATDKRPSCGCGGQPHGTHADDVDPEYAARERMKRDSRLAHTQPLSINDAEYTRDRADEAKAIDAIAQRYAKPADWFKPARVRANADGEDREVIARAQMLADSRNAHKQPLTVTDKE